MDERQRLQRQIEQFTSLLAVAHTHVPGDRWLLELLREQLALRQRWLDEVEQWRRLH